MINAYRIQHVICDPIGTRRVCKRCDRVVWKSVCDLLLSDGNFNRHALCHCDVLSICCFESDDLYFDDTRDSTWHTVILLSLLRVINPR